MTSSSSVRGRRLGGDCGFGRGRLGGAQRPSATAVSAAAEMAAHCLRARMVRCCASSTASATARCATAAARACTRREGEGEG